MNNYAIGDHVFVVADNYGSPATIIATRESNESPASRFRVQTATDVFWAFDYEIHAMSYDSRSDTLDHIAKVQGRINIIGVKLLHRGMEHDASKLEEPEKSGYDRITEQLAQLTYGGDEYRAALQANKPTIEHHYAVNTHHPEHYADGIAGMSLLDIIEMLCDWKAASERTKQGSIAASLVHNKERFGISDQLAQILENTVKELGW